MISIAPVPDIRTLDADTSFDSEMREFTQSLSSEALEQLQAMKAVLPPIGGVHTLGSLKDCDDVSLLCEFSSLEEISRCRNREPVAGARTSNKNRYSDVLPSEQVFQHMFFSKDHQRRPYFNGNEVVGDDGQAYFLTQAPVPAAFDDFWSMIYYSDVSYIVMLTNLVEGKRTKAHRYWPERKGSAEMSYPLTMLMDSTARDVTERSEIVTPTVTVKLLSSSRVSGAIIKREMSVSPNSGDGAPHDVIQYQYVGWPDHSVPKDPRELVRLIRLTMQSPMESPLHPLVVHCSAGIGRTGTFIAAHMEASRVTRQENDMSMSVNVMQDCDKMRRVRPGTVQSFEQYAFIFKTIISFSNELLFANNEKPVVKKSVVHRQEMQVISRPGSSLMPTKKLRRKIAVLSASSSLDAPQCKLCSKLTFL